ncbi:MAG: translation initiation factor IF-2 [Tyzzerella sp.]|nr:translation initiation factor IF-2 [Tyzzerella sp.]
MTKLRVHEIAKSLDKSSKEIIEFLRSQNVAVASHASSLEDEHVEMVKAKFAPTAKAEAPKAEASVKPEAPKTEENVKSETAAEAPKKKNIVQVFRPQNSRQAGNRPGQGRPNGNRPGQGRPEQRRNEQRRSYGQDSDGLRQGFSYGQPAKPSRPNQTAQKPTTASVTEKPVVPVVEKKETPVVEKVVPPVVEKPVESVVEKVAIPVVEKPVTPTVERTEKPTRNDRAERPTKPERAERPERSERPARRDDRREERRDDRRDDRRNERRDDRRDDRREDRRDERRDDRREDRRNDRRNDRRDDRMSIPAPMSEQKPQRKNQKDNYKKKDKDYRMDDQEDGLRGGKNRKNQKNVPLQQKPQAKPVQKEEEKIKMITIPEMLTIKELADHMKIQSSVIIKKLFMQGKIVNLNQEIDFETAEEIAMEFEILCEKEVVVDVIEELLKEEEEDESNMKKRPPVVCVMGHVDHGKTSLLDAIRNTNVTTGEAGGITQHIGAYVAKINGERITFLDTPGHEAFTAMRMRGANSTDIAILVVAADDGVKPQTIEAISHAKAAGIEIVVAVNKIDKPTANVERVKQELTEYELIAEDWGGSTIFVPVSAKTGEGIEDLMEMILLTAEVLELKSNPNRHARGLVIEAELDKGKGPVATVLVQKGTLRVGDPIAAGAACGKVRAMIDDKGRRVKEAGPSTPVEILGLNDVPNAGEVFVGCDTEKEARSFADTFIAQNKVKLIDDTKSKMSLDDLFNQIQAGNVKELNIIVKADVQGSVEAVKQSLVKLSNEEVAVKVIHGGVGAINESDVTLASTSNAIIIGFNVRPDATAKEIADSEGVDMRLYRVIYNAIEDVQAAMKGMLDPVFEEQVLGHAEVRQTFKASGVGTIAGSYVLDGMFERGCSARIIRDGIVIFDGALASLKRFKDDVKEVKAGYECGFVFERFNDIKEGDQVEAYKMVEIPR